MTTGIRTLLIPLVAAACASTLPAAELTVDGIHLAYRLPPEITSDTRIVVLFGGRNWDGEKTLAAFRFDALADRRRLILLAPSFRDREYWLPRRWSGRVLERAVAELENTFRLTPHKLYLYGYSAGAQCAALFADWMPERVAAWGAHAGGVFPEKIGPSTPPALLTCGRNDTERFQISRHFLYRYREAGGKLLWKPLPGGHELTPAALELARAWFDAILTAPPSGRCGEDDTMQIRNDVDIDVEFRNPLYSDTIRELWLR